MNWDMIGAIGIPILRSVGGWITKATADGKISDFEFKQLGSTALRTLISGTLIYVGAEGFGLDIDMMASAATAVILDMILSAFKENKNITKR